MAPMTPLRRIWTAGHSTHTLEAFVALLKHHGIQAVADIRAFPGSRRHPHFARESLVESMPAHGIEYHWLGKQLGGRRRKSAGESPNTGLRNESFRNYADYMGTADFAHGVAELLVLAARKPTAYFCAELLWWRCHRSLLSDYLVAARRWEVLHVMDLAEPKPHKIKPEAHLESDGMLVYAEPDLFSPLRRPASGDQPSA